MPEHCAPSHLDQTAENTLNEKSTLQDIQVIAPALCGSDPAYDMFEQRILAEQQALESQETTG